MSGINATATTYNSGPHAASSAGESTATAPAASTGDGSIADAVVSAANTSTTASVPAPSGGGVAQSGPLPNVSVGNATYLSEGFTKGISAIIDTIASGAVKTASGTVKSAATPLVGTPAPRGPPSAAGGPKIDIAFWTAKNRPWKALINDIYWEYSLGLAIGLLIVVLAFVGVRYKSIDPAVRKKLTRRLFFAFMSIFFWLPAASLATQFFHELGIILAVGRGGSLTQVANFLANVINLTSGITGLGQVILVTVILLYTYIKVIFTAIGRWIGIILLTLFMPVVAAFWALEVWPLNRFSGLSAQIAGAYPGLLAGGIPAALLVRIALMGHDWGLGGLGIYVNVLALLAAAKSQRILVKKSSKAAAKTGAIGGAALATATAAGAYAAGGPAAGAAVSGAQKAAKGQAGGMEAYQVHRAMSSKQPPQAGSQTDETEAEDIETPSSSSASSSSSSKESSDGTPGEETSSGNASDEKPLESTSGSSDTDPKDTNGGLLSRFSTDDSDNPEDSGTNTDQDSPGQSAEGPEQSPDTNPAGSGWFSATEYGQSSSELADASQDGYSQGDRVVIDSEDFDHTDKRAVVTSSVPGHVKVRPASRERSEDMALDASEVAMYEPGPEVDRQFNQGDPVRITADEFEASDSRATVTKPPVPGKKATVRPVNIPGEIEVSEADLAAVPTESPAQPTDTSEAEPAVPEGWDGDDGRDSPIEPERIAPVGPRTTTTQSDPLADIQGGDPDQSVVTGSGDTGTSAGEHGSEPPSKPQGERSESKSVSADPPQPGDEVPNTEGVETPGRSPTEITDTSPSDRPTQKKKTATTSELDPSDLVANPDADKYQQGFDDTPKETTQDAPEATERSSQQSDYRGSETENTNVGSDSSQSIDEALATDDDILGREAYADPFETENTESDD